MTTAAEHAANIQAALDSHPAGWGKSLEVVAGKDAGIAFVGAILDGEHYPYIQVDTADYYADDAALPIARLIAAANPEALSALLTERTALLAEREQSAMAVRIAQGEAEMWRVRAQMLESALKAENPSLAATFAAITAQHEKQG